MKKLSDPKTMLGVISRYDFDFHKRFGQNFLVDEGVIIRSLEAAQVGKEDVIFEIGPGIGTLTQYLSEAAHRVVSIEIDKKLIPILQETLRGYDNVDVINEDVLKVDLPALARRYQAGSITGAGSGITGAGGEITSAGSGITDAGGEITGAGGEITGAGGGEYESSGGRDCKSSAPLHPLKIVANLPYYITTPILMNLFRQKVPAQSITVMVQKEVAERMCAQSGTKEYGSLSVAVQYYSAPRIVELVPPSSFIPHPKVTSAVVTMDLYEVPPVKAKDEELYDAITRAAFEQRRKTLVNALSSSPSVPYGKEEVKRALNRLGFSESVRGEKLSVADFAALSDALTAIRQGLSC